jgi:hypothetical protein
MNQPRKSQPRKSQPRKVDLRVCLATIFLIAIVALISIVYVRSQAYVGDHGTLEVHVSPRDVKLYPTMQQYFQSFILNGTLPYRYEWFVNGTFYSSNQTILFSFQNVSAYAVLSVVVRDANSAYGTDSTIVFDPAYVGSITEAWNTQPSSEAEYIIGQYNSTHYYAKNSTGFGYSALAGYEMLGTNLTGIEYNALGNTTAGMIYLKGVQLDPTLTVSTNASVLQFYGNTTTVYNGNYVSIGWLNGTNVSATSLYCTTIDQFVAGSGTQILHLIVQNGTSFPASPLSNQVFYRTDSGYLYVYNSTVASWLPVGYTPNSYPYANLTGVPVLLFADGSQSLNGNLNFSASYGVYNATWINATSVNGNNYYLGNQTLSFVDPATFIIGVNGTNYQSWYGANSTLACQSTNVSRVFNNVEGNLTNAGKAYVREGFYNFSNQPPLVISHNGEQWQGVVGTNYTFYSVGAITYYGNEEGTVLYSSTGNVINLTVTLGTTWGATYGTHISYFQFGLTNSSSTPMGGDGISSTMIPGAKNEFISDVEIDHCTFKNFAAFHMINLMSWERLHIHDNIFVGSSTSCVRLSTSDYPDGELRVISNVFVPNFNGSYGLEINYGAAEGSMIHLYDNFYRAVPNTAGTVHGLLVNATGADASADVSNMHIDGDYFAGVDAIFTNTTNSYLQYVTLENVKFQLGTSLTANTVALSIGNSTQAFLVTNCFFYTSRATDTAIKNRAYSTTSPLIITNCNAQGFTTALDNATGNRVLVGYNNGFA